jgi:hypothetical protein
MRIITLSLCMFIAAIASAAPLSTGDGLALDLSAAGRVTGLKIGGAALPLKGQGGFAVYDFAFKPELTNLVPNGSFEEADKGWRLGKGQSLDTTVAHTGRTSAKLEVPGPEPTSSNLEVFVPAKPNTQYVATLWVRRQNVGVCGAYVSERDDAGKLTGPVTQMGVAIPKQDGVWLPLTWKLTTQPNTTRLSFRADIYRSTGTLWIDDYFLAEAQEGMYRPVTGKIATSGNVQTFTGGLPDAGLQLQAKLTPDNECLRVEGVLSDTTGRDRAIAVRFFLPLDLAGWSWWTDAVEREEIKAPGIHRYTYNCQSGMGLCSIYPWSAVSAPEGGVPAQQAGTPPGLSLALPLSQGPRVFVIQHDQGKPELSLTFFFGLSKLSGSHPSRAPFSFVLYRHDPRWGMRAAMERYYRLFPESFVKRPPFEGYLNYANLEQVDLRDHTLRIGKSALPDVSDFGEGYNFISHVHGCYDYRQIPWPSSKMMTDAEVMAELEKMVAAEGDKGRHYVPTRETIKKICRGANGEILYIGDTHYWRAQEGYNHTDQPGWGLNFHVNEDPAVSDHLRQVSRQKAADYVKTNPRPWTGTFTADAIEGYMSNSRQLDFKPEHLQTTLQPLSFGKDSLRPAMVNTIWDFLHQAWWPITEEFKAVTYGNANCYEQAFTLPYCDIPMTEGSWDAKHPARLDGYLRAMAHHKIWRYWHAWDEGGGYGDANPANVQQQMTRGLAYGIYPSVYSVEVMGGNLEQSRAAFRQYIPALEELNTAGWEPVPYAAIGGAALQPAPILERFGSFADGELHYTIRNYGDQPAEGTLQLDRAGLGIPAAAKLLYLNILPGTVHFHPLAPEGLPVKLAAGETLALWIGTQDQAAQHGFRLAGRTLAKIERLFYPEMSDVSRALWQQAVDLAKQGEKASGTQALILAESLQNALGNLQQGLQTKSPVDLTKLIYRARVYVSMAPAANGVGFMVPAPRVIRKGVRGAGAPVLFVEWGHSAAWQMSVLSPWPEVATQSNWMSLFVPAEPQRQLLPFLIEARGQDPKTKTPFTLYAPVDIVPGTPVSVSVQPLRAFRGQERKLTFTLTNALNEAGTVKVKLTAPPKTTLTPAEFTIALPARGSAQQAVTMSLDPLTRLGDARIGYVITSDKPQFGTLGNLDLTVSDPVPQLGIKPTVSPPAVDGKLDDAAWQQPPLVPELKLLADASPATEKTTVWMTYDRQGVYVAFRCRESQMDKLVAKLTQRGDPLYMDDDVEVFIFPEGAPRVYQFAVNANGTQNDNFGNKVDWKAAAQRGDTEWAVEVFIPYVALGLSGPPTGGVPWGVQFGRQQKAKRETTSWTPGSSFISKEGMGEIVFQ